jgi:hypothetical protein
LALEEIKKELWVSKEEGNKKERRYESMPDMREKVEKAKA